MNPTLVVSSSVIQPTTIPPNPITSAKPLKRYACDDCRARKVSCTGEESGCARCRRSGIECIYSPPKPPGRPRKIRRTAPVDPPPLPPPQHQLQQHPYSPYGQHSGLQYNKKRTFADTALGQYSERDLSENVVAPLTPFQDLGGFVSAGVGGGRMEEGGWGYYEQSNGAGGNLGREQHQQEDHQQHLTPPPHGHGQIRGHHSGYDPNSFNIYDTPASTHHSSHLPSFGTPKSMASTISAAATMDWANHAFPVFDASVLATATNTGCTCLQDFFGAISILQNPPKNPEVFSLDNTMMVLKKSIRVIEQATNCRQCHCSPQSAFICIMMLGTILPLLLLYMETSVTTITAISSNPHRKHSVILDYSTSIELTSSSWGEMAKDAVWKEFINLMGTVKQIEKVLQMKYGTSEAETSPGLVVVADGKGGMEDGKVGELAVGEMEEVGEGGKEGGKRGTVETPLCITMLNMIRGMAKRVQVLMKH